MKRKGVSNSNKSSTRREFIKKGAMAGSFVMLTRGLKDSVSSDSYDYKGPAIDFSLIGLLDVTQTPYNADKTGIVDCTLAIQQAVNDARDQRKICFFPSGTYLVSDTIDCEVPVYKLPVGSVTGPNEDACGRYMSTDGQTQHYWNNTADKIILLGSTSGPRPVIKLAPGAAGFGNSSSPKLVIKIWAQTRYDRDSTAAADPPDCILKQPIWGKEQANISFSNVFKGIDIDLSGNPGAIGLRHTGSQGSYMMDAKIKADGAFAGLNNCCGQGGGTYNIEVQGGQYGMILDGECRFPMLASCAFRGQTHASVYAGQTSGTFLPIVMAGCLFESNGAQALDYTLPNSVYGINLIDCKVDLKEDGIIVKTKTAGENIFLENTVTKGVIKVQTIDTQSIDAGQWINISRYSFCKGTAQNLINGVISNQTFFEFNQTTEPDYNTLHDRHWTVLPSFEDSDAVNVKDYGAVGNNTADDTQAFKDALAASNKVFVPKGTYKLTETLLLDAGKQLFGLPQVNTTVNSALSTVDDPEAATSLSFISIGGGISWRAGKGVYAFASGTFSFSGNGGGRFYGLTGRKVISNNTKLVSLYAYNVERVQQNPMSIILNAKNVKIFYLKVEAGTATNDANTPMKVENSENIRIYAVCGNALPDPGKPMVDIVNSMDVLVSQAKSFKTGSFPNIRETIGSFSAEIGSDRMAALYKRDVAVGVMDYETDEVSVYPNPFTGEFTIVVPPADTIVEIRNISGKLIFRTKVTGPGEMRVTAMRDQPAGVYFIHLTGNEKTDVIKIIKINN